MFEGKAHLVRDFVTRVETALEDTPTLQEAFLKAVTKRQLKAMSLLNRTDLDHGVTLNTVFRAAGYADVLKRMQGGAFVLNSAVNAAAGTQEDRIILKNILELT